MRRLSSLRISLGEGTGEEFRQAEVEGLLVGGPGDPGTLVVEENHLERTIDLTLRHKATVVRRQISRRETALGSIDVEGTAVFRMTDYFLRTVWPHIQFDLPPMSSARLHPAPWLTMPAANL